MVATILFRDMGLSFSADDTRNVTMRTCFCTTSPLYIPTSLAPLSFELSSLKDWKGALIERGLPCPNIIAEVSYPGDHDYATAKAKHFFLDVDERRPSAFVIMNFEALYSRLNLANTAVSVEVWRRHGRNTGHVQRAERGVCSTQSTTLTTFMG